MNEHIIDVKNIIDIYNMFFSILDDSKELSLVPANEGLYVGDFDVLFKNVIIKALSSEKNS